MLLPFHDNNPIRRWPWVTIALIVANVAAYWFVARQPQQRQAEIYTHFGFVPQRIEQLDDPQLVVEVDVTPPEAEPERPGAPVEKKFISLPADPGEILLSLVTCMFLHAGWLHLASNMWFLWLFGNNIEDRLGHVIFALFYLVIGLLASACHWGVEPSSSVPVVGASGAVAGVLGAYAVTFPKAKVKTLVFLFIITIVELPALVVLFVWFGFQVWQGTLALQGEVHSVAWWAHIGGFLGGVLLMPLMAAGAPEPGTHWEDEVEEEFRLE